MSHDDPPRIAAIWDWLPGVCVCVDGVTSEPGRCDDSRPGDWRDASARVRLRVASAETKVRTVSKVVRSKLVAVAAAACVAIAAAFAAAAVSLGSGVGPRRSHNVEPMVIQCKLAPAGLHAAALLATAVLARHQLITPRELAALCDVDREPR
jgi:hypothetical protein